MNGDVFDKLLDIVEVTGCVCLNCGDDRHHKIAKLESSLAEVTEKLSDVLMVADLENKFVSIQTGASFRGLGGLRTLQGFLIPIFPCKLYLD